MLGSIAGILSGAGSIASAFGGGKKQTVTESSGAGYKDLPKFVKDYAEGDYWNRLMGMANRKFEGTPMRRLTVDDYDPIFGSKAFQYLQGETDRAALAKAAGIDGSTAAAAAPTSPANNGGGMSNAFFAKAFAGAGQGTRTSNVLNNLLNANASSGGLDEIIAAIQKKYGFMPDYSGLAKIAESDPELRDKWLKLNSGGM
jgi:hypothetical protein